ncbi:1-acylglycerol-3-phosphate O-acyltransferase Pnpla3 [Frankliniella occidentalis]|uniref:triacylglycerol lipase n=1 Tax=Frankliniella occidentalis TaxID=133901 RepID=A0A9C6WVY0_FRAOC|nr:1-acylglycerol-3-phosphate O-acyltransferase Pnpla3 [Frankliniella occidentalis]
MNLSFAGCGFLGIYHVGVAVCFKKYAPHLLLNKISGASAGAIAACALLCDLPLGEITSDMLHIVREARCRTLGPFSPSFSVQDILLQGLEKHLPEDAHLRVSGKLHISLTRVYDGKNVIVSHFNSKEDLLQALMASAFVPIFSGFLPPKFHGIRYMDGGFSDNLPTLDENTITVSPFCGESDICPRDLSLQLFHINVANTSIELSRQNIYRFTRILFPPKPEVLSNMCKQGFDDALRFLNRNNLINCTRCLAVQSTFVVQDTLDESLEYDPQCQECKVHRQEATVANLPDTVLSIFQDAIDSANKGLMNWVFKHRGMKLLSVLSLPYTLPADLMYATFTKLIAMAPHMGNNLYLMSKFIMDEVSRLLKRMNRERREMSAQITCQLAITEYGGACDTEQEQESPVPVKNKMNFNFTLNLDENGEKKGTSRRFSSNKILSRHGSFSVNRAETSNVDDDTFEHILQVTAQHEAVMAYYYMDENNKVKVTEIYDVTDADSSVLLNPEEKMLNTQLQYDDDWDEVMHGSWMSTQPTMEEEDLDGYDGDTSVSSTEEDDRDDRDRHFSSNVFSDPESEWTRGSSSLQSLTAKPDNAGRHFKSSRPESDQTGRTTTRLPPRKYPVMDS